MKEASTLLVMQTSNLALTHLANEVVGSLLMNSQLFYQLPTWAIGLLFAFVLLSALEFGYYVGRGLQDSWKNANPTNGQIILTSMLALLGLIIAFTYGASVERFDARKQAVVLEANAMRDAFLQADLVAEPGRTELKQVLLDYARTRMLKQGEHRSQERFQELAQKSLQALPKLWRVTKQIVGPNSSAHFQLVNAVKQVLSTHMIRLAAIEDELPISVILMLLLVAAASLSVAGFNAGISGRLNRWRMTIFALVLVGVMLVILDFDQPLDGFIRVNFNSINSVINGMEANLAQ